MSATRAPLFFDISPFTHQLNIGKQPTSTKVATIDQNVVHTILTPKRTLITEVAVFDAYATVASNPTKHTSSAWWQRSAILLPFILPILTCATNPGASFTINK